MFEGEARCNAVFTATLKYHQPGTGTTESRQKSSEQASFRLIMRLRFAFD